MVNDTPSRQRLLMLGTHFDTMGGVSSVVNVYRAHGLFERLAIDYLPTHRDGGHVTKAWTMVRAYAGFLGRLATGRIGAVHAHTSSRVSFWRKAPLLALARMRGLPTVLHLHGAEFRMFYEDECSPRQQAWVRAAFEGSTAVIALSEQWADWIREKFPRSNVHVIYNPVEIPDEIGTTSNRHAGVVLSLGRIGERKGSYDLLSALNQTPVAERWSLRLGGDGDLAGFQKRVESMALADRVKLLGWVRGEDKARELREAWVFTLPSYNEGLPMGLLEAMAAGLPVVTTPIGGIPDAVTDGVEGFLVTPGDIPALRDRLMRLCHDADLARRMGQAARRRAIGTFSIDAIAPQIEAVYAELGWPPRPEPAAAPIR